MKLNQFIAQNTHLSRRQVDQAIRDKRVTVKNKLTVNMSLEVNPAKEKVRLDKKLIENKNVKVYMALYKPKDYICSIQKAEAKKKTILKYIPPRKHLKLVDRMEVETEGLILLSNDGAFINKFHDPKKRPEQEYSLLAKGKMEDKDLEKLKKYYSSFKILKTNTRETLLTLVINEGRNRQIRKAFDSIRHPVKYLQRIRIGNIKLGSLKKGKSRLLTKEELDA
ncbi:MAG: pseudouridine synthase [Candidatus Peregrinibacteria bacterium]|nr:pseudouridine synthase [Candidatus Peregrinibacteria bacterium]